MKKAIIYARYSSDSQTEQSIEGQLRVCREYAQNNDILIVDTYIDRAMTGTNDNRVAFQKMLKDSNRKEWQYLIVYKLDRFSRNKFESVIHKKTLRDNGVTILSAMENLTANEKTFCMLNTGHYRTNLRSKLRYYRAKLYAQNRRRTCFCV